MKVFSNVVIACVVVIFVAYSGLSSTQWSAAPGIPVMASTEGSHAHTLTANGIGDAATLLPADVEFKDLLPNLVLRNGEFLEAPQYTASGVQPQSVTMGDFNGDGRMDIAVVSYDCPREANCGPGSVSILLGDGDGSFHYLKGYDTEPEPGVVVAGDFNDDGIPDLAVTSYVGNSVDIYLGNGDGTFRAEGEFKAAFGPTSMAAGDFNSDGNLDLVVNDSCADAKCTAQGHTVSILLGNGDGTFQPPKPYTTGANPQAVAVADLNGDHVLDLAVVSDTSGFGAVSVLLGNGDGTFQGYVNYGVGSGPEGITLADFNGDGKEDIAVADNCGTGNCEGAISVLLGNGNGTFQPQAYYAVSGNPTRIAAADFNRDGKMDIVSSDIEDLNI